MNISDQTLDILEQQGYNDLDDYFTCLADDFGLRYSEVYTIAHILGEDELFDGLVTRLGDCYG